MIKGSKTYLRPIERDDLPRFRKGLNQENVMFHLGPHFPFTEAEVDQWFERVGRSEDSKLSMICTLDGEPIGAISLDRIHHRNRNAELVIALFDEANWGRGYGSDALAALLRFLFEEMNFHRVQLLVHEDNERAIKAYVKLGFVREGLLRDENFRGGHYTNTYVMGVLADEFRAAQRNKAE